MQIPLKMLRDFFISSPKNNDIIAYNGTTKKWFNKAPGPKVWTGTTRVAGGAGRFVIDYSSAGFSASPLVFAQARVKDATLGGRNFASIETTGLTSATGYASNSNTTGVLLSYIMTNAADGTIIDVVAIGSY